MLHGISETSVFSFTFVHFVPNFEHMVTQSNINSQHARVDQFLIVASAGRDLPEYCASADVKLEAIAVPLQVDVAMFGEFESKISFDRFSRLLEVLATITADDCFGLGYGRFFKPGGTGSFGLGLLAAPTVKDMLDFYVRYEQTIVDTDKFSLIVENDRFTIDWTYSPLIAQREQIVDFATYSIVRVIQGFLGRPIAPLQIHLERREPRDKSLHKLSFSVNPIFAATSNRIVFSSAILPYCNPSADPVAFEFMRQKCEEVLAKFHRKKDIVTIVKEDFLNNMELQDCGIGQVASRYGVSERSLQRRLGEFGVSFSELFDQTRDELSLRMLREGQLALSEIGHRLGYSSQSAYTRAVKRMHGVSPGYIRSRVIAGQTDYNERAL